LSTGSDQRFPCGRRSAVPGRGGGAGTGRRVADLRSRRTLRPGASHQHRPPPAAPRQVLARLGAIGSPRPAHLGSDDPAGDVVVGRRCLAIARARRPGPACWCCGAAVAGPPVLPGPV